MSLDIVRNATVKQLRDPAWLEDAIWRMGIYPAQEIPQAWWTVNGGLGICQYPNQFAPYLIDIGNRGLKSYAEIGLWVGGTFSVTVEYLTRFGLRKALGIDVELKPEVRAYAESNPAVTLLEAPSTSPQAAQALRKVKPDLILVDGDHTEEGCRADCELATEIAPLVAVHDIVGIGFPGVGKVWAEIVGKKLEWTAQHPDQLRTQNGIGLVKV